MRLYINTFYIQFLSSKIWFLYQNFLQGQKDEQGAYLNDNGMRRPTRKSRFGRGKYKFYLEQC